jgi:hypothetical protein
LGIQRLAKEKAEQLDISPAEARHRITQCFEIETKALRVTLEKEVGITALLNVVFTEDLKDA